MASASPSMNVPATRPFVRAIATGSRTDNRCVRLLSTAQPRQANTTAAAPRQSPCTSSGAYVRVAAPRAVRTAPAAARRPRCSRNNMTARRIVSGVSRFRRSEPTTAETRARPNSMNTGAATPPVAMTKKRSRKSTPRSRASRGAACGASRAATNVAAASPRPAPRYSNAASRSGPVAGSKSLETGALRPNRTAAARADEMPADMGGGALPTSRTADCYAPIRARICRSNAALSE